MLGMGMGRHYSGKGHPLVIGLTLPFLAILVFYGALATVVETDN